jgi:hypothetical protein
MERTPLADNEHGYVEGSSMDGPYLAPYPGWISTAEARRRWDVCFALASSVSARYEPDGVPDARWTWLATRALHYSDFPTGEADAETFAAVARAVAGAS